MRQRIWSKIAAYSASLILLITAFAAEDSIGAPPAHADVNDFAIESFDAEYRLSIDDAGRSSLSTTEHIVAEFPDFDQNRGLIRDIPRVYDGHDTNIEVHSVTDETGVPRDYTTENYGDFLAVTMAVPEGSFVHGKQHYIIEYTQRDVTRFFEDTEADEFYWDVNGTDWAQPFASLSATLVLEGELADRLNGDASCYLGVFGSTEQCDLVQVGDTFTAQANNLAAGENLTIAVGFQPQTFEPAPEPAVPFLQRVPLLIWAGIASLVAALITFVVAIVMGRKSKTGRAIIAQYEPPQGMSVAIAAELLRARKKSMTASLLDFAVRRKIRLLHDEPSGLYGAQALTSEGLDSLDQHTYAGIFGAMLSSSVSNGESHWFTEQSTQLGDAAVALKSRAKQQVKRDALMKGANVKAIFTVVLLMVLALALPVIHAAIFDNPLLMTILLAVGINVLIWVVLGMVTVLGLMKQYTPQGALMLDHLKGLREYIRLAEADRIRMLQSASGAEITEQQIVHVYERLLPYAVLFGFEKEWQPELAKFYRESNPDWVVNTGHTSLDDFMVTLPLTSFAHSVATSRATPSTSSSGSGSGSSFSSFSGGSSGGGFSGGGGGGGGGRGI